MNFTPRKSAVVVLAAGDGKRMNTKGAKALCEVMGKPMISWVIDACKAAEIPENAICSVVSVDCASLLAALPQGVHTAVQKDKLGTGHAVQCALDFIHASNVEDILVLYGDAPLVSPAVITESFAYHKQNSKDITVITAYLEDPQKYGRILRTEGHFCGIVEYSDATQAQKAIQEINSGIYWFAKSALLQTLPMLKATNTQGEYYLTDTIAAAQAAGLSTDCFISEDTDVVQGANDRKSLAHLNRLAKERILEKHYANGVSIPLADGIVLSPDVQIARDCTLSPASTFLGKTSIGEDTQIAQSTTIKDSKIGAHCIIGASVTILNCDIGDDVRITAGSHIENSTIGNHSVVQSSYISQSTVGNDVKIGPFAQLRPNSTLADAVKIGNFVEIKNSTVGSKTSVAHLTYIGDSDVGARVNFGCGVVTVNYDGKKKHRTTIGNDVFVGCNTNLIAPVTVEDDTYIAAATTITQTVPTHALAIGRVRQENKLGWKNKK